MTKPIAISSGDPCGVGPEISVKAWEELKNELAFVLYTSFSFMESLFPNIPFIKINNPQEANKVMKIGLPIFDIPFSEKPIVGETKNKFAHETISSIKLATASCLSGQSRALCTNPINKYNLKNYAGFKFSASGTISLSGVIIPEYKFSLMLSNSEFLIYFLKYLNFFLFFIFLADVFKYF